MIAEVSHEVARTLGKPNHADYTFHSFRRSSATAAADDGASAQQLISFYGWKSVNMPQEYISTSKRAVMNMASLLSNPAASTVENSINVEIKTSETTENPANTELETSLEPKPSASKGSLVQQQTAFFGRGGSCTELETSLEPKPSASKGSLVQQEIAFFGTGGSCKITKNDNVVMIHSFNGTINL